MTYLFMGCMMVVPLQFVLLWEPETKALSFQEVEYMCDDRGQVHRNRGRVHRHGFVVTNIRDDPTAENVGVLEACT